MQVIGVCKEVKDTKGNPTTEVLESNVSKRKAKQARSKWQNLRPGWKISVQK